MFGPAEISASSCNSCTFRHVLIMSVPAGIF
jgi:hypothetical protein